MPDPCEGGEAEGEEAGEPGNSESNPEEEQHLEPMDTGRVVDEQQVVSYHSAVETCDQSVLRVHN